MENGQGDDLVRNEKYCIRVKEERNVLHTVQGRKEGRKEGRLTGLATSLVGTAF